LIATLKGVDDRNAAEALKGRQLKLPRAKLPETAADDEFYIADLIGLTVEDTEGRPVGRVAAVHDFGAGDLLEIRPAGGGATFYLPFTRASVPEVDIAGRRLVVTPPEDGERGDV
ncbi:MAG TPA: 16S rRNA processing protein RimM, partial [Thermopetrobacter sp.]|nr:16S rRNA processing protein RimM [Thermopetrobacter sp.]